MNEMIVTALLFIAIVSYPMASWILRHVRTNQVSDVATVPSGHFETFVEEITLKPDIVEASFNSDGLFHYSQQIYQQGWAHDRRTAHAYNWQGILSEKNTVTSDENADADELYFDDVVVPFKPKAKSNQRYSK